jgi:hypothetical protein
LGRAKNLNSISEVEEVSMRCRLARIGIYALLAFCGCAGIVVPAVQQVFACECLQPKRPSEELNRAAAVFSGEVGDIKIEEHRFVVEIKVEKVWKGEIPKTIFVQTSKGEYDSGYSFAVGRKYLIYVYGGEPFTVNYCSRTKPLESASEDLKELGEGKQPK